MQNKVEAYYREEHAQNRPVLTSAEDVDVLIDSLLTTPPYHNLAELHSLTRTLLPSGFPDHELLVGVDKDLQVGVLEFMDADGNAVTVGSLKRGDGIPYFCVGNATDFPDGSEISIDLIRQAVKEFLASGGQRPTCIEWQEPESW
ncbi:Imm1 family immunity protein [Streptomyces sp. NPDC101234]|uniref:Imm1 family immunity protein n=1 Tax=Streptomyces sp. NPDC101234 TaxID=3366138 RepID=UPI0038220679